MLFAVKPPMGDSGGVGSVRTHTGALQYRVCGFSTRAASCRAAACLKRRGSVCERGAALVEFALVVPIFLIVLFGMFSMGLYLNGYLQMTDATEIGARYLATLRWVTSVSDPCAAAASVMKNAAPGVNWNSASSTWSFSITDSNGTKHTYSAASCTAGAAQLSQGEPIAIQVQTPCSSFLSLKFGSLYNFNPMPVCTFQTQITEISQ